MGNRKQTVEVVAEPKKRGRGRPRMYETGSFAPVYCYLRGDLIQYARGKGVAEHRSMSSALAHLIEQGVALECARRQEGSP